MANDRHRLVRKESIKMLKWLDTKIGIYIMMECIENLKHEADLIIKNSIIGGI